MKIAVIGTGNVGRALGTRLAMEGHEVVFGSRDPGAGRVKELVREVPGEAEARVPPSAIDSADLVILATPWSGTREVVQGLGDLSGKILIDCTNPLKPELAGLDHPGGRSGGEQVAEWARGARVVKALNTTGSANMIDPDYGESELAILLCGDDQVAKGVVGDLVDQLGFDAVDAGPLSRSALLESLAMLWILLAYQEGLGPDFGFAILNRGE